MITNNQGASLPRREVWVPQRGSSRATLGGSWWSCCKAGVIPCLQEERGRGSRGVRQGRRLSCQQLRTGGQRRWDGSCRGGGAPALPARHPSSPITALRRALVWPRAEQPPCASHVSKLWPDLFLSAFDPCFAACKVLKRQIVTLTDLLFLLVWKHSISQQSRSYCFAAHPH